MYCLSGTVHGKGPCGIQVSCSGAEAWASHLSADTLGGYPKLQKLQCSGPCPPRAYRVTLPAIQVGIHCPPQNRVKANGVPGNLSWFFIFLPLRGCEENNCVSKDFKIIWDILFFFYTVVPVSRKKPGGQEWRRKQFSVAEADLLKSHSKH